MRTAFRCLHFLLLISLFVSLCHVPTTFAVTPKTTPQTTTTANTTTTSTTLLPALKGKTLTVPAGTTLTVSLDQPLSSQLNKVGDPVEAVLETPLISENTVVLPKGSRLKGKIVGIRSAGGAIRSGSVDLRFTEVQPLNTTITLPLLAKVKTPNGSGVIEGEGFKSNAGQIATKTAVGAATGAVAGSLAGLLRHSNVGSGAIVGASIGAGIGLVQALWQTKPQPVELENKAPLSLILDQSLTINSNTVPTQAVLPPFSPTVSSTTTKTPTTKTLPSTPTVPVEAPANETGYYGY